MLPAALLAALCLTAPRPPATARPLPEGATLTRAKPDQAAGLTLGLALRDQAGLQRTLAAQHDPRSPLFRRWLTPGQFGERFGVSAAEYDAAAKVLTGAGLHVRAEPDRLVLHAEGTVASIERALGVTLWDVTAGTQHFRTFKGAVHAEGALSRVLQSVSGLDTRVWIKRRLSTTQGDTLGPQDLRNYYGAAALHARGVAGQTSAVGVLGPIPVPFDRPQPADINGFYAAVSDATAAFTIVDLPNPNGVLDSQGDRGELEMDAELSTVGAPQERSVTMVLAPADQFFPAGMSYFVNQLPELTAISLSYGNCEAVEDGAETQTVADLIAQGSAEGQAWFAASGDDGADDCQDGSGPAVDFPASVPYMVAVGGTSYTGAFDAQHAVTAWGHEAVWNDGRNGGAGGGGVSVLYDKPSYQTGPGTHPAARRELPDLSLIGGPSPGVAVIDTMAGLVDSSGGTSASSPLAAGLFALLNDAIGGCRLGAPQFELYALGAAQQAGGAPVFHDLTTGNLNQNGVVGPSAGVGYDQASGWGSLDMVALAAAWPQCPATGTAVNPAYPDGGYALDDAGNFDPGPYVPGAGVDAGPRAPYDPCALLACDGGAVCVTQPEGPSACQLACVPGSATCPHGQICDSTRAICVPGCATGADCATDQACFACEHTCVPATAADAGAVGDPCASTEDCRTGELCYTEDYDFFPGGMCSLDCDPTGANTTCECPANTQCSAFGHCFPDCSVSAQTGCRTNYTCWNQRNGDVGVCQPTCTADADCDYSPYYVNVCDTASGACVDPSAGSSSSSSSTSSSSSSSSASSSSASSASSSSSSSSGTSTTSSSGSTSGSTGTHASSSSGASSSSSSSSGTTSSGGTTAASTTGAAGTTGAFQGEGGGGCGCTESPSVWSWAWVLVLGLRRRART
jgi:kumamolisin